MNPVKIGPMDPRTQQYVIQKQIVASFLVGTPLSAITKTCGPGFPAIYTILQDHFQGLVRELEKATEYKVEEATARAKGMLHAAEMEIRDLRAAIEAKDEEISACLGRIAETGRIIDEMTSAIEDSSRRFGELLLANEGLEQTVWQQDREIELLSSRLTIREQSCPLDIESRLTDDDQIEAPFTDDEPNHDESGPRVPTEERCRASPALRIIQENQVLDMFDQGSDLETLCSSAELPPEKVFDILRRRFGRPDHRFIKGISWPAGFQVDRQALARTLMRFSFLFSPAVVDKFLACTTIGRLADILMAVFDDFGDHWDRDWGLMAAFVVDMISHSVVHDEITVENLTKQIAQLKSTRGKLTREFRTRQNAQEEEVSSLRMEIRELRKRVAELEASRLGMEHGIGEAAAADGSRPDILREMNDIAARQGYRRYSDSLYYMAVVMIFRSRSTYEFLRNFLPLPAPNSIYDHFRDDLHASLARLKSMDQVGPYLSSQIERYPDIAKGAVLAVDAVSCSSAFVGMKTVEKSGIGYLFVVFLQPLIPTAKCCPIFIIEHPSGIGNPTIQKQIDQIAAIAHAVIYRVFIGSDGDPSYNRRHLAFFDYWNQVDEQFGLNRVLRELKQTRRVLPLGDLLHLAKHFRIRFLLFLLTFVWDEAKTTIDRERVLDICGRGPAFTDLAPLGKMRDSYPLAMTRVENILALIDNDAIAAAIALLPLSLAFNAIRLETIAKQTRTDLLRISFFIVRKVYENRVTGTDTLPETTSEEQNAEITVFHGQWTLRFINTVLDLLLCIEEYDHVALDRVSTHPEENFFGLVRMDAHDVNTADEMERTIAHTHIVKEAQWHLGLEEHVHNRLNLAGVHIDSSAPPPITIEVGMPDNLTPDLIADICLHAVHVGPDGLAEDEALGFRNFVQYLRMLRHAAEVSARNREANHRHISGSGGQIRTHLVC